jgi:hypothetical protein
MDARELSKYPNPLSRNSRWSAYPMFVNVKVVLVKDIMPDNM